MGQEPTSSPSSQGVCDPLVSVVIPTYYRNKKLKRAIESISNQTYREIEIIVVDDSGEGHARPTVEKSGVDKYIEFEKNHGAQYARTIGIEESDGSYINLLDDDDYFKPLKIEKQVSILEQRSDVGVCYCGFERDDGFIHRPENNKRGNVLEEALSINLSPCITSTMLIDGELLRTLIPLNDRPGADDIELKIELAMKTNFDFVDEPLLFRSSDKDSRGSSSGAIEGRKEILSEYKKVYEKHPQCYRNAKAYTYLPMAKQKLHNSYWSPKAIMYLAKAVYYKPSHTLVAAMFLACFGKFGWEYGARLYQILSSGSQRGKAI